MTILLAPVAPLRADRVECRMSNDDCRMSGPMIDCLMGSSLKTGFYSVHPEAPSKGA
jgi:hypothetical protein